VSPPGRVFGAPSARFGHRPVLKAARQHLDGVNERLHLRLEQAHAVVNRGLARTGGRWFR